ncbi:MAG: lysozyme [Pseudomonadota bacterium]
MSDTPTSDRKPIFDSVRAILKRGFRQSEVSRIDRAIDRALGQISPKRAKELPQDSVSCVSRGEKPERVSVPLVKKPGKAPRNIGEQGIDLIKRFEGCARLRRDGLIEAYPDPGTGGDPWTIGWGATGPEIARGLIWTQGECDARLATDLKRYADDVTRAIGDAPTSQAQFDAMVSFHYNTGAIDRATLTKKHVAGDFVGAAAEFARWNKAGGRVLKGLVRRRAAETQLYTS